MSAPLRVCIDARLAVSDSGGTASFALSLVRALTKLADGDEQYYYLLNRGDSDKLTRLVGTPIRTIEARVIRPNLAHRFGEKVPFAKSTWKILKQLGMQFGRNTGPKVAKSDGTLERQGIDVVHFTAQYAFLTNIPSIYHPHDLQHRHLPQFFAMSERANREYLYSTLCKHASIVSVVSQWGKEDLMRSFDLPESKIRIVHFAPEVHGETRCASGGVGAVAQKFELPNRFIFYPARTWPHKNHLRLLHALKKILTDKGMVVSLVCSGAPTEFYGKIKKEIKKLRLQDQVRFVGFVNFEEVGELYDLCSGVIIPTLFEAGSFPLWEAFLTGKPAACSNVTSLPGQAGDAALIFDPYDVDEMAKAIERLWTERELCATLVARGKENLARYSWDTTARTFRALYRELGKRALSTEDEELLSRRPLM
ncbi:MAG: glycosyltransferase family 1 protein [Terracidiphilus sp.]|jgi:glycosyltransferase involved in cell wall biosynthesis